MSLSKNNNAAFRFKTIVTNICSPYNSLQNDNDPKPIIKTSEIYIRKKETHHFLERINAKRQSNVVYKGKTLNSQEEKNHKSLLERANRKSSCCNQKLKTRTDLIELIKHNSSLTPYTISALRSLLTPSNSNSINTDSMIKYMNQTVFNKKMIVLTAYPTPKESCRQNSPRDFLKNSRNSISGRTPITRNFNTVLNEKSPKRHSIHYTTRPLEISDLIKEENDNTTLMKIQKAALFHKPSDISENLLNISLLNSHELPEINSSNNSQNISLNKPNILKPQKIDTGVGDKKIKLGKKFPFLRIKSILRRKQIWNNAEIKKKETERTRVSSAEKKRRISVNINIDASLKGWEKDRETPFEDQFNIN